MKKKKSVKYVLEKKYIHEISFSEIDFDMYEDVGIKDDDKEIGRIDNSDKICNWGGETAPIGIDRMMKALQEMKDKGCDYVEIMYHEDHIGYELSGLMIRKYEEGTLAYQKYLNKMQQLEMDNNQKQIQKLEAELKKLKKLK